MKTGRWMFVLGLAMLLTVVPCVWATDYTWSTGSGNWSTSGNWTPSGVPGAGVGDTATITIPGTYTVTLDTPPANSLTSLTLNDSAGTAYLVVTNAVVNTSTLTIGDGGVLELDNGSSMSNANLNYSGTTGLIILNGSTFALPVSFDVNGENNTLIFTNTSGVRGTVINPVMGTGGNNHNNVSIRYYGVNLVHTAMGSGIYIGCGNNTNDSLIIGTNTTWTGQGDFIYFGYSGTSSNNAISIAAGSVFTNFGDFQMGGVAWGDTMRPSYGYNTLTVEKNAILGANTHINVYGNGELILVDGGVVDTPLIEFGTDPGTTGNMLIITNGGKFSFGGGDILNYCSNGTVVVTGAGSILKSTGISLYFGYQSYGGNVISVRDGGTFEFRTLDVRQTSDVVTNVGGIYQFATTDSGRPNLGADSFGAFSLVSGKIAWRNVDGVDVNCCQPGGKLDYTTKILYSGTNGFVLDGATNLSSGQAYTFAPGTPTNWASLTLRNGATYQGGDVTIGAGGSLIITNGANTMANNLVMQSGSTLALDLSATTNSSLNVQGNANFSGGSLHVGLSAVPPIGYAYPIIQVSGACTDFNAKFMAVTYENQSFTFEITHIGNIIALIRQPPGTGVFFH